MFKLTLGQREETMTELLSRQVDYCDWDGSSFKHYGSQTVLEKRDIQQ